MSHLALPDTSLHHRQTPPLHLFSTPSPPFWKNCGCCAKKSESCARRCACSNTNLKLIQPNRKRPLLQNLKSPPLGPVYSVPWTNELDVFRIGNSPFKEGRIPAIPPQAPAQLTFTPLKGGKISATRSAVAHPVSKLWGPNLNRLVFRVDFSRARNPRLGSGNF